MNQIIENAKIAKVLKSSPKKQELLIRLVFNREIIKNWIKQTENAKAVEKIVRKLTVNEEQSYFPIIDSVYEW